MLEEKLIYGGRYNEKIRNEFAESPGLLFVQDLDTNEIYYREDYIYEEGISEYKKDVISLICKANVARYNIVNMLEGYEIDTKLRCKLIDIFTEYASQIIDSLESDADLDKCDINNLFQTLENHLKYLDTNDIDSIIHNIMLMGIDTWDCAYNENGEIEFLPEDDDFSYLFEF